MRARRLRSPLAALALLLLLLALRLVVPGDAPPAPGPPEPPAATRPVPAAAPASRAPRQVEPADGPAPALLDRLAGRRCAVHAEVRDEAGQPLGGLLLDLAGQLPETDPKGEATAWVRCGANFGFAVASPGWSFVEARVLPEGEARRLVLVLARGEEVHLRLVDEEGESLAGCAWRAHEVPLVLRGDCIDIAPEGSELGPVALDSETFLLRAEGFVPRYWRPEQGGVAEVVLRSGCPVRLEQSDGGRWVDWAECVAGTSVRDDRCFEQDGVWVCPCAPPSDVLVRWAKGEPSPVRVEDCAPLLLD